MTVKLCAVIPCTLTTTSDFFPLLTSMICTSCVHIFKNNTVKWTASEDAWESWKREQHFSKQYFINSWNVFQKGRFCRSKLESWNCIQQVAKEFPAEHTERGDSHYNGLVLRSKCSFKIWMPVNIFQRSFYTLLMPTFCLLPIQGTKTGFCFCSQPAVRVRAWPAH